MKKAPTKKKTGTISNIKKFLVEDIGLEYVIAFIIVVILTPFIIKVLVPYFNPKHRIREPSSASAECSSLSIEVERVSSPILYRDEGITPTPEGMYAGYKITNNSGSDFDNLWASASNFTGSHISLAPNENGSILLDSVAYGETTLAYFYLVSDQETDSSENHLISLYETDPSEGGDPLCSATFLLTAEETIKANANKVNSVTYAPPNPELGGTFIMTITGETGIIGAEKVFAFTPASYPNWPADTFELTNVSITLSGGNSGTYDNTLFLNDLSPTHTDYEISYTFEVKAPTAGNTAISPQSYISSGMRTKHTNTKDDAYIALSPISRPDITTVIRSKSASAETLPEGGNTTYTLEIVNNGLGETTLDKIVDHLPTTPAQVSYVPGSSSLNGASLNEPVITGNKLVWTGNFTVLPEEPTLLTYDVFLPPTSGTYTNSAVGFIGESQIDTTEDTNDNAPAQAILSVSMEGISPEDPDAEPETPEPDVDEDVIPDEEEQQTGEDTPDEPAGDQAETETPTEESQDTAEDTAPLDTDTTDSTIIAQSEEDEPSPPGTVDVTEPEGQDETSEDFIIDPPQESETEPKFYKTYYTLPSSTDTTQQQNRIVGGMLSIATVSGLGAFLLVMLKPSNPMGVRLGGYSLTFPQKLRIAQRLQVKYYRMEDVYMKERTNTSDRKK